MECTVQNESIDLKKATSIEVAFFCKKVDLVNFNLICSEAIG